MKEAATASTADLALVASASSSSEKHDVLLLAGKGSREREAVRHNMDKAFKKAELAVKLLKDKDIIDAVDGDITHKERPAETIVLKRRIAK